MTEWAVRWGLVGGLAWSAGASAQLGSPSDVSTVNGNGSAEVKQLADTLRMTVLVRADGKDVRDALAKLKERQTALRASVEKLKADAKSIRFGATSEIPAAGNDQNRARTMMMQQRMGGRAKRSKKEAPKAPVVTLSSTLTAEFPLKAADDDDLLVKGKALEDEIKAADFGGMKAAEAKAKAADDEETAEEEMMMQMSMSDDGQPKAGETAFVYMRRISNEDRAKLLSEAYGKAKTDAARLAQAAGRELGTLRTLSENTNVAGDDEFDPYQRQQYYRMMQRSSNGRGGNGAEGSSEAIGMRPGLVSFRVTVSAAFALK